jgi:replicative DNA helicase
MNVDGVLHNSFQSDVGLYDAGNANESAASFELFRIKMRRAMLWNQFVYRITRELQRFALAYEAGQRPKMAIVTPPQFGKQCADSTPICTTRGWVTHGDLRVNDFVFHPSGRAVRVLAVSDKSPARIRVELSNGEVIYTHERHEWCVIACRRKGKPALIMETQELMRSALSDGEIGKRGHHYQFQLPRVQPIQGVWQSLPLAPYALGVWLGNGTRGAPVITQDSRDDVIAQEVERCGWSPVLD